MKTITIEVPDDTALPFGDSEEQFARELRLAAAIFWYDRGMISQGKGAEIAGVSRADFLDALFRAKVPACQVTIEEWCSAGGDEGATIGSWQDSHRVP